MEDGVDARIGCLWPRPWEGRAKKWDPETGLSPKPRASIKVSVAVERNSTIRKCSVIRRRQLRPNEMVAGVGGEPNNLPLHSKWAAVMV